MVSSPAIPEIVVIGAGGHGREVASYLQTLEALGVARLLGFSDDKDIADVAGIPVLSAIDDLRPVLLRQDVRCLRYITAVGSNEIRVAIVNRLAALGVETFLPWTLRHPAATIGEQVEIGEGSLVAPGAVITTDVRIGRHCIINVGASVSHDCVVEDYCNINPGARVCGNVHIGAGSFVGAGATVINDVCIGEGAVVGAGAVVVKDVPAHSTVVGVPARVLERR